MTSGGNDFNYFPENQLIKLSAVYLFTATFSGGARKISLPGHNRGTIISNGAHAIRLIIMTNTLVGSPLT